MTETARMYGGSLYDLAAEEGLEARILGELDEAVALFKANPDYLHLLSIPSIPKKERCALLDEAFRGQVHLYVLNFMKLLCEKGALRELPGLALAGGLRMIYSVAAAMLLRRPARRLRTVPSSSVPSMSSRMPPSTAGSTFVLRSMCLPVTFSSFSCRRLVCSAVRGTAETAVASRMP